MVIFFVFMVTSNILCLHPR